MTQIALLLAFIAAVWLADRFIRSRLRVPPAMPCDVCRQPTRLRVRAWHGNGAATTVGSRLTARLRPLCPEHAAVEIERFIRS